MAMGSRSGLRGQGIAGGHRFGGEADLLTRKAAGGNRDTRCDQHAEERQTRPTNGPGHPHADL
jgi:hypothetical protein